MKGSQWSVVSCPSLRIAALNVQSTQVASDEQLTTGH